MRVSRRLSPWEQNFCSSILAQVRFRPWSTLSPKQVAILDRCISKIVARGAVMRAQHSYKASHIKRFRSSAAEIQIRRQELYAIVDAMRPMTVRQVFYQATVKGIVEKTEAGYAKVQTDLVVMRKAGDLPYGWLADNTRWQRRPRTYDSIEDALEETARFYRKSLWRTPTPTSKSGWRRTPSAA